MPKRVLNRKSLFVTYSLELWCDLEDLEKKLNLNWDDVQSYTVKEDRLIINITDEISITYIPKCWKDLVSFAEENGTELIHHESAIALHDDYVGNTDHIFQPNDRKED